MPLSPGGYSSEFLVGVCLPVLQILTHISDQNMPFFVPVFRHGLKNPYPFSDLASVYIGLNYGIVAKVRTPTKDLLKFSSNDIFRFFLFALIHLELKRQIRFYALVVPLKTIPDFRP